MFPLILDAHATVMAAAVIPVDTNTDFIVESPKGLPDQYQIPSVLQPTENRDIRHGAARDYQWSNNFDLLEEATIAQTKTDPSIEETTLFEQVFGTDEGQIPEEIEIPFILNGHHHGDILISPHNEVDKIALASKSFMELAEESLSSILISKLEAASDANGQLSLLTLQENGLNIQYDHRHLELHVHIPAELRPTEVNTIGEDAQLPNESTLTTPGNLSAYVNLRGNQTINWADEHTKLEPLGLQFDGALNWQGWVLEAYGQSRVGQSWQLDRLSVVRDQPAQAMRYTFGDISVPTEGYQTSPSLLGVSAARNFSLQPFNVARPTSNYSFFLERAATVDVFVNERLTTTLSLDAGPQDIRDLPLKIGINDIRLEITNDLGQTKTLNFSTGVAGELLAEGVHQFAYSAGFPTLEQQPFKSYDLSQPTLSLFHRVGLTSNLTLGSYLQGDITQQLAGFDGTWATTVGNFGWDLATSHHQGYGADMAGKFFYQWLEAPRPSAQNRQLRMALEYRGENFSVLGQETPQNSTAVRLSVAYQQALFDDIKARINGEYQLRREGSDAYNVGLNLSRKIAPGLNFNLGYRYGQNSSRQTNHRLSLGLNGTLPFTGQRFNTRTELNDALESQSSLNWSYSPNHTLGAFTPNLTLTQSAQNYGMNGRLQYQGYRSSFGLNHQIALPRTADGSVENNSTLTWGTAIAFVDGVWGWSRPIDNSFTLIKRQGSATNTNVRVNPSAAGDLAQANTTGPGVLAIAPYNLTQVSLDAPNLEVGESLGQTNYQLLPTYRSGTLITTGTEATVLLRGVLVDPTQEPITLQQGWLESLSDPNWPVIEFFTNRTGQFAAAGLQPGRYRLHLSTENNNFIEFEITEQQQGNVDIGTLQLTETISSK